MKHFQTGKLIISIISMNADSNNKKYGLLKVSQKRQRKFFDSADWKCANVVEEDEKKLNVLEEFNVYLTPETKSPTKLTQDAIIV